MSYINPFRPQIEQNPDLPDPTSQDAADLEAADETDEDQPICGETYDHTLKLIDSRDGSSTYECTECGAEIHEDDEETAS